jgi:hypothetical protein
MFFKEMFKVKVRADENGNVIQQNPNKPEYGSIGFEQCLATNRNNFLNFTTKVSFISGTMADLEKFAIGYQLKAGMEIPGCLFTEESYRPFWEGQEPKINPSTGHVVLVDGAPVYQKTFYDPTGSKPDVYITGEISQGQKIADPITKLPASLASSGLSNSKQ